MLDRRRAQTCDLLETLTKFVLYFLTTATSQPPKSHPQHEPPMMKDIGGANQDFNLPASRKELTFFPPRPFALAATVWAGDCGRGAGPPLASERRAPGCALPPPSPADSSPSPPRSSFQGHRREQIPSWRVRQTPARPPGCPGPAALSQPVQWGGKEDSYVQLMHSEVSKVHTFFTQVQILELKTTWVKVVELIQPLYSTKRIEHRLWNVPKEKDFPTCLKQTDT